jgi:precorrin-2/cobalt-factor-2 C20-methyltransferase
MSAGRLFGVGVGPGDPELLTLKALRLIREAHVVAYPAAKAGAGNALAAATPHLRTEQELLPLVYPVTASPEADLPSYPHVMRTFYDETAEALAQRMDRGLDVCVLCEGDPFFYGSFIYWHARLKDRYDTTVTPGVSSVMAGPAALGVPLCLRRDTVTIIPGTLPPAELARRLAAADAAVVMKLGRTFAKVRAALVEAGVLERAFYVERASQPGQRTMPAAEVDPASVPYFSIIVVPSREMP